MRNHEDAEDAVQDALFRAWSRGQFEGRSAPMTYLAACVRNRCLEMLRVRRTFVDDYDAACDHAGPDPRQTETGRIAIDVSTELAKCFRVLPPMNADVARLMGAGMTEIQGAEAMHVTVHCFKTRRYRTREMLRVRMPETFRALRAAA